MGYTNYWERTEKPITQEFVDEVKQIIKESWDLGISIFGIVTLDCIEINGDADCDLDHEAFILDNKNFGSNFCKTARKPYDWTVKEIIASAKAFGLISESHDDGEIEHKNDKQWLYDQFNSLVKRLMR